MKRAPCEFTRDCGLNGLFCDIHADPDQCLKHRRFLIKEGIISRAGWEFNRFEAADFDRFWRKMVAFYSRYHCLPGEFEEAI